MKNRFKIRALILLMGSLVGVFCAQAAQQSVQEEESKEAREEQETKEEGAVGGDTHPLFIFLDSQEINNTETIFVCDNALAALQQKAGPVLVSGFVLSVLFNHEELSCRIAARIKCFRLVYERQDKAQVADAAKYIENQARDQADTFIDSFDSQQWVIRQVSEDLFLLVPVQYLGIGGDDTATIDEALDVRCGFNTRAMKPIQEIEDNKQADVIASYFSSKGNEYKQKALGQTLDTLLAAQLIGAFKKNGIFAQGTTHTYVMCIMGHGLSDFMIAEIPIKCLRGQKVSFFHELLDLCATKVPTKALIYNSCYAAGITGHSVYGDVTAQCGARTYPFTIVTGVIADAPTGVSWSNNAHGFVVPEPRFDLFTQEIKENTIDYTEALARLLPVVQRPFGMNGLEYASVPQLRMPYSPCFSPVFDSEAGEVVTITKVVAATREDPLIIDRTVKAILVAATQVPFPIIIDNSVEEIPPFISLLPGEATHSFALLISEKAPFGASTVGGIMYPDGGKKYFHIHRVVTPGQGELKDVMFELGLPIQEGLQKGTSLYKGYYSSDNGRIVGLIKHPHDLSFLEGQPYFEIITEYHKDLMKKASSRKADNDLDDHKKRKGVASLQETCHFERKLHSAVEKLSRWPEIAKHKGVVDNDRLARQQALEERIAAILLQSKAVLAEEEEEEKEESAYAVPFEELVAVAGVDKAKTSDLDKALISAADESNVRIVRILLDACPSQEAKDEALYNAALLGNLAIIRELIAAGASNNYVDMQGNGALYQAVRFCGCRDGVELVQMLLKVGYDQNRKNDKGETLLSFASKMAQKDRSIHQAAAKKVVLLLKKYADAEAGKLLTFESQQRSRKQKAYAQQKELMQAQRDFERIERQDQEHARVTQEQKVSDAQEKRSLKALRRAKEKALKQAKV